jgi:hypothetical protein
LLSLKTENLNEGEQAGAEGPGKRAGVKRRSLNKNGLLFKN